MLSFFEPIISLGRISLAFASEIFIIFTRGGERRKCNQNQKRCLPLLLVIIKMRKQRNSCSQQNKHINTSAPQRAIRQAWRDSCPPLITKTLVYFGKLASHSPFYSHLSTVHLFVFLCKSHTNKNGMHPSAQVSRGNAFIDGVMFCFVFGVVKYHWKQTFLAKT